ncbi:hypothetical protein [Shewanella surugensis]|uniref:Tetratricopeptide repeat protein n=1 Tax=Shewanella surugensis TaxID=212020 RepID=A0ABT0LI75_9GAMM|nr:hypothetical protein [Shewanella surugensis]MCL1127170.1 hypothetical protein [Shewanella surugensis]
MDIPSTLKAATSLAKESKFDDAIDLLKLAIPKMVEATGYSGGHYTKIIPYFQKADRYLEGVKYSEKVLIKAVEEDSKRNFKHKCEAIQGAFQA